MIYLIINNNFNEYFDSAKPIELMEKMNWNLDKSE